MSRRCSTLRRGPGGQYKVLGTMLGTRLPSRRSWNKAGVTKIWRPDTSLPHECDGSAPAFPRLHQKVRKLICMGVLDINPRLEAIISSKFCLVNNHKLFMDNNTSHSSLINRLLMVDGSRLMAQGGAAAPGPRPGPLQP